MKNNWQTRKLGEICDIYQPKTISSKEMTSDGKYVVFGANGIIGNYDKYNHEEPQLLITCRGATCGSVNISMPKSWITGNAMVVRPKNHFLELKYLEYIFRGGLDMSKIITGAAQPQITRSNLEPVEISYPESLREQLRIVKIIDEAFEKIEKAKENTEKNLKNSRDLFDSYLQNIFSNKGWEVKKIGEVAEITSSKRIFKSEYVKIGVPFYRTKEIVELESGKSISLELFISEKRYKEIKDKFRVPAEGDLLLTAIGTIGNVYIVKRSDVFYFKDGNILWLKPNDNMDSNFLRYAIRSYVEVLKKLTIGAAYNALTIKKLRNHKLPIPDQQQQKEIIKRLDEISEQTKKLEEIYKQKLVDLEELKKSILNEAFSGKL